MNLSIDAEAVRQRLEDERTRLLARYKVEADAATTSSEEQAPDYLDLAARDQTVTQLEDLSQRDYQRLRAIAAALLRLEEGTYGLCVSCEEPIDTRRLEAVPEAFFCIACAQSRGRERNRSNAPLR